MNENKNTNPYLLPGHIFLEEGDYVRRGDYVLNGADSLEGWVEAAGLIGSIVGAYGLIKDTKGWYACRRMPPPGREYRLLGEGDFVSEGDEVWPEIVNNEKVSGPWELAAGLLGHRVGPRGVVEFPFGYKGHVFYARRQISVPGPGKKGVKITVEIDGKKTTTTVFI